MGAAAHEGVTDRAQGLPRCVSALAERLKGAQSTPAAQHCEGSVLSRAGRAAPSGGGPGPRPARGRLHTTAYGVEELPEFRCHVLEVLRQSLDDRMVTITRVLPLAWSVCRAPLPVQL
jgi:hypothetical protein